VRRILFRVHLWTGLSVGLYLLVVCVTGSALVFRIDLQRALHPGLFTPTPGPQADPATIMERVRDAFPGDRLSGVEAPTTLRPTYLAYVVQGQRFRTVLVDPTTGRVLGELPEQSFLRTLQELQFNLLAGRTGRTVNGLGAIALLLMCATGLVIWWPGRANWRSALAIDARRNWRRITWELHRAAGFWAVGFIAMWAVTGLSFAFSREFRQAVNWLSPITVVRAPLSDPARRTTDAPSWRSLIERAHTQKPGQFAARIVTPSNETAAFLVMFSAVQPTPADGAELESVYLDRFTGDVLLTAPGARTVGDVFMAWVAPLHIGNFGSLGIRVVWAVIGLVPPMLFATGFFMWWTRVVRHR
jgi:uncharacterized iron-regulated membrane protein